MLKNKVDIFDRLSHAGYRIKRRYKTRHTSSSDLFGTIPIIDADFVEVKKDLPKEFLLGTGKDEYGSAEYGSGDRESAENLLEYLKGCSVDELTDIFEEILRIMGRRGTENEYPDGMNGGTAGGKKKWVKEFSKTTFDNISRVTCRESSRIKEVSKNAASKASRLAAENKDSVREVSGKIYYRLRYSSPEERNLVLMVLLQAVILRKPALSKNPAFKVLLSSVNNPFLNKEDVEGLVKGISRLLRRRA